MPLVVRRDKSIIAEGPLEAFLAYGEVTSCYITINEQRNVVSIASLISDFVRAFGERAPLPHIHREVIPHVRITLEVLDEVRAADSAMLKEEESIHVRPDSPEGPGVRPAHENDPRGGLARG